MYAYSLPSDAGGAGGARWAGRATSRGAALRGAGEQRDCRRQQSSMRARYVAGESGVAIFALVAEKSRARNSLVQQVAPRGV